MKNVGLRMRLKLGMQVAFGIRPRSIMIVTCGCCGGMNIKTLPDQEQEMVGNKKCGYTSKCYCLDCGARCSAIEIWEVGRKHDIR